ncbi:DNA polymerase [Pseudomonas aeruginosa]|uniref:DNA polymerase n=1 Tax=Pseudomonas aeruginosa TaxID=287 RepID=UPI002043B1DE|nr:DNA polymerase [Pseudomonas aeruginosa]MCM4072828.1 DNA polymerase [Pseudomonas aeruginosa]MCM4091687.1 DNA polymerase [Pseudomonas aeruginosa]MCM4105398.1 DNA polymerase [Pseudomonas aeruginosa]MCM4118334.1 DNA polymerase [Pseudomonas aeruginosa]
MFIRDYTEQNRDRFFLWHSGELSEVSAEQLIKEESEIICHDYWLIAPTILKLTKQLPKLITDIDELRISTSGDRKDRESREKIDISKFLNKFTDDDTVKRYKDIFNKKSPIANDVLMKIGEALLNLSTQVEEEAVAAGEWERFTLIERPVTDYLIRSTADGIAVDTEKLRRHKQKIDFDYYMALKNFSARYDMPLEIPSDEDIINYLEPKGFDFSGVNVDYVLKFVPMQDNFSEDLINLMKTANSRKVLNSIPLSQRRIFPIVDNFGSITSRIYFKDPSLQNLAKYHRDILIPDEGKAFSYIDYEQYEAGIMAALSGDPTLTELYASGDLYEKASEEMFGDQTKRKQAKRLFLSYAYGMKRKGLYDAAAGYGAERQAAKNFFNQFKVFEEWKNKICSGQPIPDSGLSFSSATAGGNPSLN